MIEIAFLIICGIGVIAGSIKGLFTERFNQESILMCRIGILGGFVMVAVGLFMLYQDLSKD
jgi:hypothetical protein